MAVNLLGWNLRRYNINRFWPDFAIEYAYH